MEAVKVQDVAVDDLPWTIEYHSERCTLCGSCLASCTFGAIKPVVRRQSVTVSEGNQPKLNPMNAIPSGLVIHHTILLM